MKTYLIAGLLGASALAGAVYAQQAPTVVAAGKPQIGAFGFDEAGMDRSIAPGDDFYNYANGTWAKTTAIPADKSSFGAFDTLADLSRDRTRGILEAAAKQPGSKIGTAYATYLDTGAIEA
jgi:putative endopeptidase